MPIPRYQPGTGNLGAAQPILDELGGAYNKGVETIEHPMNAIRGMLGMPANDHQAAIDQMTKEANDQRVRDANQTFTNPVVAPPRRKSMGKM